MSQMVTGKINHSFSLHLVFTTGEYIYEALRVNNTRTEHPMIK